jgi:hypothetical protein
VTDLELRNLYRLQGEAMLWTKPELTDVCISLVTNLNNFAFDYENGTYPARTLLGQLHRSIAR